MASKKTRIVKFRFSTTQCYALEFGENYIRFFRNGLQITSGGTPVEVTTEYLEAELFELDCRTQSADTLYIFHHNHKPSHLVRTSDTVWSFTEFTYGGKFASASNYPSCGTFHEDRLILAATDTAPQTIWGSASGGYDDFALDPEDPSAGIEYRLVSGSIDRIRWLFAGDYLLAGTIGGIWKIWSSYSSEPLSQENINASKQVFLGASGVYPEMVEDAILFVTRLGTSIRRLAYSLEADKMIAPTMMRIASHIAEGTTRALSGIVEMAFQMEPYPILWAVRTDGQLLGMVYDNQDQVYAWFRVRTDGIIESVAVISEDGKEDQVWIVVKRTIATVAKRYIEYFMPHQFFSVISDCFFVHSGLTLTGINATITLAHLVGKSVVALVDGKYQGPFVVPVGGVVTLTTPSVSKVHAGLPYTSIVEPMKLHVPTDQGTARGKKQKINRITGCFYETGLGVKAGPDQTHLKDAFLNEDHPVAGVLFTGDKDFEFEGDWGNEATITITQNQPLPMTILALIPRVTTHDED